MIQKRLIILSSLILSACGGALKYNVPSTAKAPGADAAIVADVKKEQLQTLLDIKVSNLPPPERISSGFKHYVAWFRRDSSTPWVRLAIFKYDEGSRKAELKTAAPETVFDFQISTEEEAAVASPSAEKILSLRIGQQ